METLELILGFGGIAAIMAALMGLPVSCGVLARRGVNADLRKLPFPLRLMYTINVKKTSDGNQWSYRRPELCSLWAVVVLVGMFAIRLFEVDDQTDEIRLDTDMLDVFAILAGSMIFWWLIFTFGTELWLKRKWLPKHAIRDSVS